MKREALAILSSGALVPDRKFGNRCLLDIHGCEHNGDVPLLDAHRADELLGHVTDVWVENFVVKGTLRFTTLAGRRAFEELPSGVSIGSTFKQDDVVVVNRDGGLEDFDAREWREYHQDPAAVLHVKRWTLLEVSLTDRPADRGAIARPINREARRIRRRMQAQQRSLDRDDDDDGLLLRAIMPSSQQILHGSPELIQFRQADDRRLVFYGD
jgi:hypothetical protein